MQVRVVFIKYLHIYWISDSHEVVDAEDRRQKTHDGYRYRQLSSFKYSKLNQYPVEKRECVRGKGGEKKRLREGRREKREARREEGGGRKEEGGGKREKGEARREEGGGRREKGDT